MQRNQYGNTSISNKAIVVTAVSCVLGLLFVIGNAILFSSFARIVEHSTTEPVQEKKPPIPEPTIFQEGYSIEVPKGFALQSREETEQGYVIYRFRDQDRCRFTFAIIPDESINRIANPPRDFSGTLVESVDELSEDIEGEVDPAREWVDGMAASVFRFYEKETFRGVKFTYLMVAMDRGRKLVLKIAGKHGGYNEKDEDIVMPEEWYHALLTLQHVRDSEKPSEPQQP